MVARLLHKALALYIRAKSDDDDDNDYCDNKKNAGSARCQKPQDDDLLTIILAVVLPVVFIIVILGAFFFRSYRKYKKEDLEHDPDFDENGEATALPDMPNHYGRKYEMEDPFDNRHSARFPPNSNFNRFNDDARSSSGSFSGSLKDGPVESFILPYQHQTGSKVSLDEYARQLGEFGSQAYMATPRASMAPYNRSRNSSFTNVSHLNPLTTNKSHSVSPQKSNLKYETQKDINVQNNQSNKYETIPDHSITEIQDSTIENMANEIEEISDSDSDSNFGNENIHTKSNIPKFQINYENESEPKLDNMHEVDMNESTDTFNTTTDHLFQNKDVVDSRNPSENNYEHEFPRPSSDLNREINNYSPFDDTAEILQTIDNEESHKKQSSTIKENGITAPVISTVDEPIDGDFDFSNESANVSAVNTVNNEQMTANTSASNLDIQQDNNGTGRKSPRISAFNLLKNDSDDEDDENENANEAYDENQPLDNGLSPEQEEELKRMKSVYKLYFDRENSVKRKDSLKSNHEGPHEFIADPTQPLPEAIPDVIKINNNLKVDTDYNKRLTTTSSIYTDSGIDYQPEMMAVPEEQQYYAENEVQQYNYYLQDQSFQQFYQNHIQSLPPLQNLPNPSDIRQSTIQTYTDYQPRSKNNGMTSPTMKQPFNPIENENVWSAPMTSPTMNSHPSSFNISNNNNNTYQASQSKMSSAPSATQLARSSVVMLNPVTEITKQRKFKPAGSLPTVHNNGHAYAANYQQQQYTQVPPPQQQNMYTQQTSTDSLVPRNKREETRKMINGMNM